MPYEILKVSVTVDRLIKKKEKCAFGPISLTLIRPTTGFTLMFKQDL